MEMEASFTPLQVGLGLNFYALTSYYLGSLPCLHSFTISLLSTKWPMLFYYITLLKFGLIRLSGAFSFKRLFTKVSRSFHPMSFTGFALMSFATSQLEINTWLDALF